MCASAISVLLTFSKTCALLPLQRGVSSNRGSAGRIENLVWKVGWSWRYSSRSASVDHRQRQRHFNTHAGGDAFDNLVLCRRLLSGKPFHTKCFPFCFGRHCGFHHSPDCSAVCVADASSNGLAVFVLSVWHDGNEMLNRLDLSLSDCTSEQAVGCPSNGRYTWCLEIAKKPWRREVV